jgi:hypothetical protein
MPSSIAAAYEEAMKKKAMKHGGSGKLSMPVGAGAIGEGFPGQGTVQPSHMGSQSASPTKDDNYYQNIPMSDQGPGSPMADASMNGMGF